jgi:hypothetical protein
MGRRSPAGLLSILAVTLICALSTPLTGRAQSLRVTAASMDLQNLQAVRHGYTFARTPDDVRRMLSTGALVAVRGSVSYVVKEGISFPYARPEVRDFIARLADGYHAACGEQLVVTSLTRPRTHQPRHASKRSVHPAGMAMDLRRSWNRGCRSWLELTLLTLEANGVLDAMLESHPPHYHVALFPDSYRQRGVEILERGEQTHYQVTRGDTLWKIAKRHQTDVFSVKQINGLRSNRIYVGQVLVLPSRR